MGFLFALTLKNIKMEKKLNMPQTDFNQRSEAPKREPELLTLWDKLDVFKRRNTSNTGEKYTLHDGPPFANGDVHVGHVLNKVLKDMVSKYQMMSGKCVDFRPGFDCHGLPTELAVQKKFGRLETSDLRDKCKLWATEYSNKQRDSFKMLGVLADWDNCYYTMSPNFEVGQLQVLYKFLNDGSVYLDNRPVHYSPSSRTVLAESELEYKTRKDKSAYFTLNLLDSRKMLVWTTQPWTVLGNVAVCVNPDLVYVNVKLNGQLYVVAKNMKFGGVVEAEFLGSELEGLVYTNSLTNREGRVVCDKFVKASTGTGLVHLCPAHGEDDFDVCQRHNLKTDDLTDASGKLLVNGLFCLDEGSKAVLQQMQDVGMLFSSTEYEHSYPYDWRTGGPVYFKLTEQFFLDLKDLRERVLDVVSTVDFGEDRWKNRLTNMLNLRDRWCLSRQRKWGFPLAVFLKDNKPFLNGELQQHLTELFSQYGSDCWFKMSDEELLPTSLHNFGLVKCEYTMDVWFDSGVSWHSVVGGQSDLCFEGSDQHRGWFQSSLLTSVAMTGQPPYKKVLTHGFVLDDKGRKMSKSVGNVVEPKTVQQKYNTDVLRLWVAVVNYGDDAQLGDRVLKSCSDYYFKFRNTLKYLLGNMYGYDGREVSLTDKENVALEACEKMYKDCLNNYSEYNFRKCFETMMAWVSDFSSQYLDVETKSFLYEYDVEDDERQRCQYVLKFALERFMKVLAPMCSFLAEDAYQHYEFKQKESVFFEEF